MPHARHNHKIFACVVRRKRLRLIWRNMKLPRRWLWWQYWRWCFLMIINNSCNDDQSDTTDDEILTSVMTRRQWHREGGGNAQKSYRWWSGPWRLRRRCSRWASRMISLVILYQQNWFLPNAPVYIVLCWTAFGCELRRDFIEFQRGSS